MLTFLSETPVISKCFAVARHQVRRLGGRVAAQDDPTRDKVGTVWR